MYNNRRPTISNERGGLRKDSRQIQNVPSAGAPAPTGRVTNNESRAILNPQEVMSRTQEEIRNQRNTIPLDRLPQEPPPSSGGSNSDYIPPPPPPPEDDKGSYLDPQVEEYLRGIIANGPRDTSAEEALAQKQVDRQLGQALADSRARAGFAGFGLSGAAQAAEGDMRSKAADAALAQIFGLQQGARDEDFRNKELATGAFDKESGRQLTSDVEGERNEISRAELDIQADAWKKALEILDKGQDADDKDRAKEEESEREAEHAAALAKVANVRDGSQGSWIYAPDGDFWKNGMTGTPADRTYRLTMGDASPYIDDGTLSFEGRGLGGAVYSDESGNFYVIPDNS